MYNLIFSVLSVDYLLIQSGCGWIIMKITNELLYGWDRLFNGINAFQQDSAIFNAPDYKTVIDQMRAEIAAAAK